MEDIDCGGLAKVVQRRKQGPEFSNDVSDDSDSSEAYNRNRNNSNSNDLSDITLSDILGKSYAGENIKSNRKRKNSTSQNSSGLTLSDILEVFDGVMESKVI